MGGNSTAEAEKVFALIIVEPTEKVGGELVRGIGFCLDGGAGMPGRGDAGVAGDSATGATLSWVSCWVRVSKVL